MRRYGVEFYPGVDSRQDAKQEDPVVKEGGLGSQTDLQCFTILYQDHIGGLLVLNPDGQWIEAPHVEDALIVNIGDFLS